MAKKSLHLETILYGVYLIIFASKKSLYPFIEVFSSQHLLELKGAFFPWAKESEGSETQGGNEHLWILNGLKEPTPLYCTSIATGTNGFLMWQLWLIWSREAVSKSCCQRLSSGNIDAVRMCEGIPVQCMRLISPVGSFTTGQPLKCDRNGKTCVLHCFALFFHNLTLLHLH